MTTTGANIQPRISLSKLGEYLVASPMRRRRIILDQKQPKTFIVATYQDAFDAIVDFIVGLKDDEALVKVSDDLLADATTQTEWQQQRAQLCVAAIDAFMEISDALPTEGLILERGDPSPPHFPIAGVGVSVRPEVVVRGTGVGGETVHGAVKLYLAKENPLTQESGAAVATALYRYVDQISPGEGRAANQICWVIDVFAGEVFGAPKSHKRVMQNLEAACEEIAARWQIL